MRSYAVFILVANSVYFGASNTENLWLRAAQGLTIIGLSGVVLFHKEQQAGDEE